MTSSARGPWLDQCMLSARDLRHPDYSSGQLSTTRGVSVQRIRYSYNPSAPPRFRRTVRRIGPDGKITYEFVQDTRGCFNADGTYAKDYDLPPLQFDVSAQDNVLADKQAGQHESPELIKNQMLLAAPPPSPLAETGRSTERVRQLQALLGDQIATTHGKPPPMAAPYYQSGGVYAGGDETPVVLPV